MAVVIPYIAYYLSSLLGGGVLVNLAVAYAASWLITELDSGDTSSPSSTAAMGRGIMETTATTEEKIRVIYGRNRVAGNDVFRETVGTNNHDLWIVQCLGEGELNGIYQVDGVDQLFINEKIYTEFGGNVSYWFHSGSATQTYDTNLNAAIPKWTDNLRYASYIVFKLKFDRDYFKSFPTRTVVVEGKKLYDFRTGSTAFSRNPVLALYDFMTDPEYGYGKDPSLIDITTWTSAANYCDTKGLTFDFVISGNDSIEDIISTMLSHFRGEINEYNGKIYLRYSDLNYEASAMTLTDADILQDESGRSTFKISQPSTFNKVEGYRVKFIDPDKNYRVDTINVGDVTGVMADLPLLGFQDRKMAADIGRYRLKRNALDRTASGIFHPRCSALEPHDIITLTSDRFGLDNQLFRVVQSDILSDQNVSLTLIYEDISLYTDDENITPEGIYACTFPDPNDPVPPPSSVSMTEETYNYRGRTFTRLKVDFTPPVNYPYYDHVDVYISFDGANYKYLYPAVSSFAIDPVEEGATYYIKLKTVSIYGGTTTDAQSWTGSRTVAGLVTEPDSLDYLSAIVNANTINLYSTRVQGSDIEAYEFRLGSSWTGSIFLGAYRNPNLSLYGVKPGSHTFYCNTLSNNGLYGANPQFTTAVLPDPPLGWTVVASETCDYNGVGTHSNTEYFEYNSKPYLKCSHTGGVLTGTYKSPIYDRTTAQRFLTYVAAEILIVGAGTTWDDVIPVSTTWDAGIGNKTWYEVFELPAGPNVKINLYYDTVTPPTNKVEKQEILSAVIESARYFQVEIIITDPQDSVNALVGDFVLNFAQ